MVTKATAEVIFLLLVDSWGRLNNRMYGLILAARAANRIFNLLLLDNKITKDEAKTNKFPRS